MDGVLVDSMPYHVRAWEVYLERLGRDARELNERMHGKHNDELLREVFGAELREEDVKRMGAEKEALYRELIAAELEGALIAGARRFLTAQAGRAKAVASNAEAANVNFVLDGAGLREHFRLALSGDDVKRGKPDPEIYLRAAAGLGLEAGECLVFEDSQTGIDAARAAGMRVVAINSHRTRLVGQAFEVFHFDDPELERWLAEL